MPSPAQLTPRPRTPSAPARVPTPGEVGLRRILAVTDVLLSGVEESELVDRLLPVLRRTVPADTVLWLASDWPHPATWRADPAGAVGAEQVAALAADADDPLLAAALHGSGAATRRSDVHTDHEFHRLPLYPALFAPLGARRQLVMAVRPDEQRRIVVLFNRSSPDFTQHDVAVAEAVRPADRPRAGPLRRPGTAAGEGVAARGRRAGPAVPGPDRPPDRDPAGDQPADRGQAPGARLREARRPLPRAGRHALAFVTEPKPRFLATPGTS